MKLPIPTVNGGHRDVNKPLGGPERKLSRDRWDETLAHLDSG